MLDNIESFAIGIVGGGRRCKALLEAVFSENAAEKRPRIVGVADSNPEAAGIQYAREKGVFATSDYRELFSIEEMELLLELTPDKTLNRRIMAEKPPGVLLVDHYDARAILDYFRIKAKKNDLLQRMHALGGDTQSVSALIESFYSFVLDINAAANAYGRETRQRLVASEESLAQILNGTTIPTFVIDQGHRITHWNRACEKLTGYLAKDMLGTDDQWKPFRAKKRPTMADLILDDVSQEELWRHYGTRWERSTLVEGAYEAEEFFPHLGAEGTWLFFTAAPIKSPDGSVVGVIETLWDRSRRRKAEQAHQQETKKLAQMVEELRASEQTLAQIIDGSTIPTFVIGRDHQVTYWNKALERLSGWRADQIVGTTRSWAPFYENERPSMADVILEQIEDSQIKQLYGSKWRKSALIEGAYEADAFFPHLGNGGKWCWFTAAPIRTGDGEVVGAIETIWDKTEDRKAELERERHTRELATYCSIYATLSGPLSLEGRIKAAIEEVANIFLLDGICIYILRADRRLRLQYSRGYSEELCFLNRVADAGSTVAQAARDARTTIVQDPAAAGGQEMEQLAREGYQSLVYLPILDKGKSAIGVIRAASRSSGYFGPNEVRSLELIANRIGVAIENSMLEQDVKRRAGFQSKLIGSSNDGIVATDEDWKIVIFNPAATSIFGYTGEEVLHRKTIRDIYPQQIIDAFEQAMAAPDPSLWRLPWQETLITSRQGDAIPVRFSGTVLREKHKKMGIVTFFQDLREIKRLQKELLGAERLAAVGQTVAGMAHCVKNILHGFKGGSYLVNIGIEKHNSEKLATGWDMVQRNIGRTSDLVQDLLSYSKEREPEIEPCRPNDVAAEVVEMMRDVAEDNGVALEAQLSPEIDDVMLDPRSLYRSLLNLVTNAIDACRDDPNPGKTYRVNVTTALDPDGFIRFDVSDNGSGMSDEVKTKLFSSFFSTKGTRGTGLGLLVTSKLVEEHDGAIRVESQPDQGSTFSIRLPLRRPSV